MPPRVTAERYLSTWKDVSTNQRTQRRESMLLIGSLRPLRCVNNGEKVLGVGNEAITDSAHGFQEHRFRGIVFDITA
jgi:hypothetical protein